VTDYVYCLVKIIQKDERIIAAVQFEIKLFDFFSTTLNSSLIIIIRTYTVNYRNALDRLRVRMNIISGKTKKNPETDGYGRARSPRSEKN